MPQISITTTLKRVFLQKKPKISSKKSCFIGNMLEIVYINSYEYKKYKFF